MGKWEMVKLISVCDLNMGQSPESSSYNQEGEGIPFYQGNADFGELHPETRFFCSKPTKIAEKDDILLSVRAPIGALNIATETCCIGRGLAALRVKKNVANNKYLYYILKMKNDELNQKGTGTTFKAINKQNLSEIYIPLPPLKGQKQIAKTLDTVTELLAMCKQQHAELDKLIKSVYYNIFKQYINNKKCYQLLPQICSFIDYRGKTPEKSGSGIPLITAKNIKENFFSIEPQEYIPTDSYETVMRRGIPKGNDVVFTTEAPLGNVCRIPSIFNKFAVGQRIIVMQPFNEKVTSEFLEFALASNAFQNEMIKRSSGSTVRGIRSKELAQLLIPVPPLHLQNQFTSVVIKIEEQKALVKKAIDEAQHLFDRLKSDYFE